LYLLILIFTWPFQFLNMCFVRPMMEKNQA
jgi:hypothetical protein